jgi:hypothetical protein
MTTARPRVWMLLVVTLAAGVATLPAVKASSQGVDKTIIVGVVDASWKPAPGLTVKDFAVREDNIEREVVSVKPATDPVYLYILADTSRQAGNQGMMGRDTSSGGTELIRDIRGSLAEAVKKLYAAKPDSQTALMEFGQAAIPITKFTNKLQDVEKGIGRLFPKPDAGSVLLEALIDSAKALAKVPSRSRAMISVNIEPGEEESRQEPQKVLDALRASGATLWSISLNKGSMRNPARDVVLNRLTQITGGHREFLIGPSAIENMLKRYVDVLTSQYEVTYKRPAASTSAVEVRVAVRAGLKAHSSWFAPK